MIIPVQQNMIDTNVGGADLNPGSQGIAEAALSQTMGKAVDTGLALYNDMVRAEAEEAVNAKESELAIKADRKRKELETQSVGGYVVDENGVRTGKTITEAFRDWANDEYHSGQTSMPNQLGQDLFRQRGMKMFSSEISTVMMTEYAKRAEYFETQRAIRQQNEANDLQDDPQMEKLFLRVDKFQLDLQDSVKNKSLAADKLDPDMRDMSNNLTDAWVVGEINKIKMGMVPEYVETGFMVTDPRTGKTEMRKAPKGPLGAAYDLLDVLQGKSQEPDMAGVNPNLYNPDGRIEVREKNGQSVPHNALYPEVKDRRINELIAFIKSQQTKEGSDFEAKVRNISAGVMNGQKLDPKAVQSAMSSAMHMIKLHPHKKIDAVEGMGDIFVADALSKVLPLYANDPAMFKTMTTDQQKGLLASAQKEMQANLMRLGQQFGVDSVDLDYAGQSAVKKLTTRFKEEMAKNASDYATKPTTFLAQSDPRYSRFMLTLDGGRLDQISPDKAAKLREFLTYSQAKQKQFRQAGQAASAEYFPEGGQLMADLGKRLNNISAPPSDNVKHFNALRANLREHFKPTLEQLIDKEVVKPEFRLLALLPPNDPMRQKKVYDLMATKEGERGLNKAFEDKFGREGLTTLLEEVQSAAGDKLLYEYQTDPQAVRLSKINQVYDAVSLLAKQRMLEGMEKGEAAKSAVQFFLGDRKEVKFDTGLFGWGGTKAIIPSVLNDGSHVSDEDKRLLDGFVRRSFSLDGLKKLPWDLPKNMGAITPEKFIEHVAEQRKGNIQFGEDPNGELRNSNGTPVQGVWIKVPAYQDGKFMDSAHGRVISAPEGPVVKGTDGKFIPPEGKSKVYFVPLRQAIVLQQEYEREIAEKAKKMAPSMAPSVTPQRVPMKKGQWGK